MTVSLNAIDKPISYDTRIDYYIDLYKFAGELLLSFRLPVLLSNFVECYCIDVAEDSFQYSFLNSPRKVVIAGTRNWISEIDKQKPKDTSIKKMDCFTSLVIAIEIKKAEIPACINMFSKEPSELTAISEGILQNALEVALYRYNEKTGGASFLVPSYVECDRIDLGFIVNFIEKRFHRCHFNLFHFPLIGASETPISREAFAEGIHNWRYFFSKARYDFKSKKYVECIIASAISIESYAWEKARSFCANELELKEYTTKVDENGEARPLSATQLYKKLYDDKHLSTELSKTKIENFVQTILNPRNDIMHGKKTVAMSWGGISEQVLSKMIDFYGELNESVDENLFLAELPRDEEIKYRDFVLKCQKGSFESLDSKQFEVEKMIELFPQMELPKIEQIRVYLEAGHTLEAEKAIEAFLQNCNDPCATAVDLCPSFIKTNLLDLGISTFSKLKQFDARSSVALALLFLYKFQSDPQGTDLGVAYALSKKASMLGAKYVLADIVRREIAIKIGAKADVEALSKQLVHTIQDDYWFPLCCVGYELASKEYTSAVSYLNTFFERFVRSEHVGIKLDYYVLNYDIPAITNHVSTILSIFEKVGQLSSIQEQKLKAYQESLHKERAGYLVITDISSKGKGEMPLGNLLYKDLPSVIEGYYIYK